MKFIITLFASLIFLDSSSQALTVQETLLYINSLSKENMHWVPKAYKVTEGYYYSTLEISEDGYIQEFECRSQALGDIGTCQPTTRVHHQDLDPESITIDDRELIIHCKNSEKCSTIFGVLMNRAWVTVTLDSYNQKRFLNAFKYLFSILQNSDKYRRSDLDDPFSPRNTDAPNGTVSNSNIPINYENGNYILVVQIGPLKQNYIIDSGASESTINTDIEKQLISRGLLKKEDYLTPGLYRLADGSIIQSRRVNLAQLKIGNFTLSNVVASVGTNSSPLLIGSNVLSRFNSWSIDNGTMKLRLQK